MALEGRLDDFEFAVRTYALRAIVHGLLNGLIQKAGSHGHLKAMA